MGNFLGCLVFVVFGIILLIYGVLRNIYNAAFGNFTNRSKKQRSRRPSGGPATTEDGFYEKPNRKSGDNRIYPDNVGEYVDYEEVR